MVIIMEVNGNDPNKLSSKTPLKFKSITNFEWDEYLKFCDGTPAPPECFNQNIEPPRNEFELKQKLEVTSPDNRDFVNLATVVNFFGPRLQLRLDGCDSSNDFFELVDSEAINPIGTHKIKNHYFAAPLRFRKDAASYSSFCAQILKNSIPAPKDAFKASPKPPVKNLFAVGMKLEAVDIKHPSNICPATIVHVDRHFVEIHLDGWDQTNDYKCSYLSRNLFPVGWCKKTGHFLQHPGPKVDFKSTKNDKEDSINTPEINEKLNECIVQNNHVVKVNNIEISTSFEKPVQTLSSTKLSNSNNSINNNHSLSTKNSTITNTTNNKVNTTKPSSNQTSLISKTNRGIKREFQSEIDKSSIAKISQTSSSVTNGKKLSTILNYSLVLPTKKIVNLWSVEDVIEFLNLRLPEFSKYENQFRSHEIDGKAFLLLTNELIIKFMNIKLGYSLKISNIVDQINGQEL